MRSHYSSGSSLHTVTLHVDSGTGLTRKTIADILQRIVYAIAMVESNTIQSLWLKPELCFMKNKNWKIVVGNTVRIITFKKC